MRCEVSSWETLPPATGAWAAVETRDDLGVPLVDLEDAEAVSAALDADG
jgi:hypothetical protein